MAGSEDTEITLGTGKMVTLFFGLVALCAVFFGMGFSLGKKSAMPASGDPQAAAAASSAVRPPAVKAPTPRPPSDLTFYRAVGQKDPDSQLAATHTDAPAGAGISPEIRDARTGNLGVDRPVRDALPVLGHRRQYRRLFDLRGPAAWYRGARVRAGRRQLRGALPQHRGQ